MAAARAHNLHPELLAAIALAEQRNQSRGLDAAEYQGAMSILGANTSIGLSQIRVSTALHLDLFADLLPAEVRKSLSRREAVRLLASDEFNIFAAARYIRMIADAGVDIHRATFPNTLATFPAVRMDAFALNSSEWPDDNIGVLASEYASAPWDDLPNVHWANFVLEAYRDVLESGCFESICMEENPVGIIIK